MSIVADAIRPHWLPGLHAVSGNQTLGIAQWINAKKGWQVYTAPGQTSFSLSVSDRNPLLAAFATDVSRMATSAIESIAGIRQETFSRKSIAWMIIRSYYSTYFASHAIMRMLGVTCTHLSSGAINIISRVADAYGVAPAVPIQDGYYKCSFDSTSNSLQFQKISGSSGGSHEVFWNAFRDRLKLLSAQIEALNASPRDDQAISTKIGEIVRNLEHGSDPKKPNANFLSVVRNAINYKHMYGCWFPYAGHSAPPAALFRTIQKWAVDPMQLKTQSFGADDLERFVCSCAFLLAICRDMCIDMNERCPSGKSFHHFGIVAFLSFLGQNAA